MQRVDILSTWVDALNQYIGMDSGQYPFLLELSFYVLGRLKIEIDSSHHKFGSGVGRSVC
jgi:hypothetical protein